MYLSWYFSFHLFIASHNLPSVSASSQSSHFPSFHSSRMASLPLRQLPFRPFCQVRVILHFGLRSFQTRTPSLQESYLPSSLLWVHPTPCTALHRISRFSVIPWLPCSRKPALGRSIIPCSGTMQGLPRSHKRAFMSIPTIITLSPLSRSGFHLVLGCRRATGPPLVRFRFGLGTDTQELRTQPHDCALPFLFVVERFPR